MKIAWITVLYHTSPRELSLLKDEIKSLGLRHCHFFAIDNTKTKKGYAYGVNRGIRKGLAAGCDVFFITHPDISASRMKNKKILEAASYFDIWGYTMHQNGQVYYGGELNQWRMSGELITSKPMNHFQPCDFVYGSFMVVKRKVIEKIGLFDEKYSMCYEDVDYCLRARKAGFKIGLDTKIVYDHFEKSASNPDKTYELKKSRLRLLMKYGSWQQKLYEVIRFPKSLYENLLSIRRKGM